MKHAEVCPVEKRLHFVDCMVPGGSMCRGTEHVSRDSDDYIGVGKGACLSSALLVATQRAVDYQAHQ